MAKPLTREQTAALAADLRAILDMIEADDLDSTGAMRHRIEGALTVLDVVDVVDVVDGRAPSAQFEVPATGD